MDFFARLERRLKNAEPVHLFTGGPAVAAVIDKTQRCRPRRDKLDRSHPALDSERLKSAGNRGLVESSKPGVTRDDSFAGGAAGVGCFVGAAREPPGINPGDQMFDCPG
jgi:hypothetical protein